MSATVFHEQTESEIETPTQSSSSQETVHEVQTPNGGVIIQFRRESEFDGQIEGSTATTEGREHMFGNSTPGGTYVLHNDYQFDVTVDGEHASARTIYHLVRGPDGEILHEHLQEHESTL
jgi:hypothetical protein